MSKNSSSSPPTIITREKAREILWRKGNLLFKLDSTQKELYDFVHNNPNQIIVIGASRRLGKSYFLLTLAFEECLKKPNRIVKYVAQTLKEVKKITDYLIKQLTADCPKDLIPHFHTHYHSLMFPNGSQIHFAGTEMNRAENLRGSEAHLCIVDEAGFCNNLDYIVNSILFPLTTLTKGKIILASTPSISVDHPFIKLMIEAEKEGRLIKKTIYDNPRLSPEDIEQIAQQIGGKDSIAFRREYLVEIISSDTDAVLPEFTKSVEEEIVKLNYQRPPYFDAYVSMDIGGKDLTAVLFAYYDFLNNIVVVEDELVFKETVLSDELAEEIKKKEKELWGYAPNKIFRYSDNNNLILLNDLVVKHDLVFIPTRKDDKKTALNDVRTRIKTKKLIIHPRCVNLVRHMRAAVWATNKKDFAKSSENGHYDCVDALVYLIRNINYHRNPYPENYNLTLTASYNNDSIIIPTAEEYVRPNEQDFVQGLQSRIIRRNPFLRRRN